MIVTNLGRQSLWWGILGVYMVFWLGLWEAQPSELPGKRSSSWGAKTHCAILGSDSQPAEKPNENSDAYIFTGIKDEVVLLELSARGAACTGKAILVLMDRSHSFVKVSRGELPNKIQAILPQEGEYLVIVQQARGKSSFTGKYCLRIRSSGRAWQTFSPTDEVIRWGPGILQWAPQSLELQASKGSKLDVQALFNSQVALRNLRVNVSPRLKPFLKTDPVFIRSVYPQVETPLEISVEIPRGAQPGLYNGEISLKRGRKILSQRLPVSIQILDNLAPMSKAGQDQLVALPEGETTVQVRLDGSGSTDPDGTIVSHIWIGTPDPEDVVSPMLTLKPGIYDFALQVTDDKGATALDSVNVTVLGPPLLMPLPEVTGEQSVTLKGISLPGATILLTNSTTGETKEIVNENGLFEVPFDLASGMNEFQASAKIGDVQSSPAKLKITYAITRTLHLDSISPPEGQSGSIVTLTGSGFTPDPNVMGVHFIGSEIEGTGSRLEGKGVVLQASETELKVVVPFIFLKSDEAVEVYVYDGENMSNSVTFHVVTAQDPTPDTKGNESTHEVDLVLTQLQGVLSKLEQIVEPRLPAEQWSLIEEDFRRMITSMETLRNGLNAIPDEAIKANLDAIFGSEAFIGVNEKLEHINELLSHSSEGEGICNLAEVIGELLDVIYPIRRLHNILEDAEHVIIGLMVGNGIGCFFGCVPCCAFIPMLSQMYSTVSGVDGVVSAILSVFEAVIGFLESVTPTDATEWKVATSGPYPGIDPHVMYTNTTSELTLHANFISRPLTAFLDRYVNFRIDIPDPLGVFHILRMVGIDMEGYIERALGEMLSDFIMDLLPLDELTRITVADLPVPSNVSTNNSYLLTVTTIDMGSVVHSIRAGILTGRADLNISARCGGSHYPGQNDSPFFSIEVIDRPSLSGPMEWKEDAYCFDVHWDTCYTEGRYLCDTDEYRDYISRLCNADPSLVTDCNLYRSQCYDSESRTWICTSDQYQEYLEDLCNQSQTIDCSEMIDQVTGDCIYYGHWVMGGKGFSSWGTELCGTITVHSCFYNNRYICEKTDYVNYLKELCPRGSTNRTCRDFWFICQDPENPHQCDLADYDDLLKNLCGGDYSRCANLINNRVETCYTHNAPAVEVYWSGDAVPFSSMDYDSFNIFSNPATPYLKPGWYSVRVRSLSGETRESNPVFVGPSPNLQASLETINPALYPGDTLYLGGNYFTRYPEDHRLTLTSGGLVLSRRPSKSLSFSLRSPWDLLVFDKMFDGFERYGGMTFDASLTVVEDLCADPDCSASASIKLLPHESAGFGGEDDHDSMVFGGLSDNRGKGTYLRSAAIGDLNGDGINDLAVGASEEKDQAGYSVGAVYIAFGRPGGGVGNPQPVSIGFPGSRTVLSIDLSSLDTPSWDVVIKGDSRDIHNGGNSRRIGNSLAIGDIDGDGIDDLLIGTTDQDFRDEHRPEYEHLPLTSPGHIPGKAYVFFGRPQWSQHYNLTQNEYDLKVYGDALRELGYQVGMGRILKYGTGKDIVISAPSDAVQTDATNNIVARTYIISGLALKGAYDQGVRELRLEDYTYLFPYHYVVIEGKDVYQYRITNFDTGTYTRYRGDGLGKALATGDIDGDGYDDIVLGAPDYRYAYSLNPVLVADGAVYILYGGPALHGTITINVFDSSDSFHALHGPILDKDKKRATGFGKSVHVADLNGDGRGDVAVGSPLESLKLTIYPMPEADQEWQSREDLSLSDIGRVYLIDGSNPDLGSIRDINYVSDMVINGSQSLSWFGFSLASGDINNDGIRDLLVGAPGRIQSDIPGRVWVLYGQESPLWQRTEGRDVIYLETRRWYSGNLDHTKTPGTPTPEGIDYLFTGEQSHSMHARPGFGAFVISGDLPPYIGDDVVISDPIAESPVQNGHYPGVLYVFHKGGGPYPLTIHPETVNMNYCDSEQLFTISGGLKPYQFKWKSCWQTYIGQPPFQTPGEVLCSEDFPLPDHFEVTYGNNTVLLRINGCVPNDLKELWLRVYDSPFHGASASRQVNFLKPEPDISVSPTSIDFGDIVGNYKFRRRTIEVRNAGQVDLQINSIDLTGSTYFSQTNDCPNILPALDNCTVTIEFRPTLAGLHNGTLTIRSNDPDEEVTNVGISGNVIGGPDIQVIPTDLEFPEVPLGSSLSKNVILTNMGISDLHLSEISITGTGHENVEFSQSNNCSGVLSLGASCVITVTFTPPNIYMAWWATLSISSDDPDEPVVNITLSGYGIPSALSLSPQVLDMGDWMGSSPLYITNESSACVPSLNWEIAGGLPSWLSVFPTSGTVTSCGGAYAVTVQVDRSGLPVGVYRHTILVNSNSGSGSVEVRMSVAPFLSVTPVTINFEEARKRLPFTIRNTSDSNTSLNWNIAADLPSWLTASQMSGAIPPGGSASIYLYANRTGLNMDQTYTHTLSLTSNGGDLTIPVSLSVPIPLATFAKYYGGDGYQYASVVRPTSDGGFITTGISDSFGAGYGFYVTDHRVI